MASSTSPTTTRPPPQQFLLSSTPSHHNQSRQNVSPSLPHPSTPPPPPPPPRWPDAKVISLATSIAIGLIIRFAIPKPTSVSTQAWKHFTIFLTTIVGLIFAPPLVGAWAFTCLTLSVITKTLPFSSAFTNEVIWLIVASFFFSRGFVKTSLGDRIAMHFVRWLGKSTLGLSYKLALSEALICPTMPSTTTRKCGIFLPIIKSLSISGDSLPKDASSKKLGAYLIQSQFQVSAWGSFSLVKGSFRQCKTHSRSMTNMPLGQTIFV